MDKKILDLLKEETDKLIVQVIIQEEMLKILNKMQIPGEKAEMVSQQKAMLQANVDINRLTTANLKSKIKEEENK